MLKTRNLKGRKFGNLVVLQKHKQSRNGGASWICKCVCGRETIVNGYDLVSGKKTTCSACNYGKYCFFLEYVECKLPTGMRFVIDRTDYPLVSHYKWVANRAGYFLASTGQRDEHIFLHRLIMNPPAGLYVDHIDGDKSNCRRSNLRICTKTENNRNVGLTSNNQSGYKGVHWAADRGKWRAEITVDRDHIRIGSFDSAEEAARAYDEYALFCFGEYAKTNKMLGLLPDKELIAV